MKAPLLGSIAVINSGYVSPENWIAWADEQISKTAQPPLWLIELSLAKCPEEAREAIFAFLEETPELPPKDLEEAELGLIILQYFEGKIGFRDLLERAGTHADGRTCSIDCEFFFEHLNRYEKAAASQEGEAKAAAEIRTYLEEAINLGKIAKAQTPFATG